jgi:D-amino peptidase
MLPEKIFIIADIEGSSGCWSYRASEFNNSDWFKAVYDMTMDVKAVAESLLGAGVQQIIVKDFHRTAYNVMKEFLPKEVSLVSGYKMGPIPGIGDVGDMSHLMMLGMHSSSGSKGFLAHTFTSRISELLVNDKPVAEVKLFSALLSEKSIIPVFLSGCPVACKEAEEVVPNIDTFPIVKTGDSEGFNEIQWRRGLADAAKASLFNDKTEPVVFEGPFHVRMKMRDGSQEAKKLAKRWKLKYEEDTIIWENESFEDFYYTLIRICYFTPLIEKILPVGLPLYNFIGWAGLQRARLFLKKQGYVFS